MDTAASMLVVDDDPDIRQTLAELLSETGRRVATARDGYDALEKLDSLTRPCVILLDLMMPRMSGLELLDHLSKQPGLEDVQVIVMSANDGLRRHAERHSIVRATLRKPFDFDGLLCLVEGWGAASSRSSEWSAIQ